MIELYKFNNKDFDKAGDIVLQPSKCILTMELETGLNEIELTHPLDKEGRWKYINFDDVISVSTPYLKLPQQLYRVYERVKEMSSITVKARHIFYDLIDTVLIDVRPTDLIGEEALNYILKGTKYKGHSNISKINTAYYVRKNIVEAIGGDKENSFLSRWGGELFLNNFDISINEKIGLDNGVIIAYGKNITGIEETLNFENVVTRAIPVGADGLMLDGDNPWVDSALINNYSNIKMKVVSYDDVKVKENSDDEEGFNTIEEAREELKRRVQEDFKKGMDKPLVNYSVQFLDLSKVETYKDYKILEEVLLGDTVHINHKRLGINLEARVIKFEYNCLTRKMENIELGNYIDSYAKEKADNSINIDNISNSFDNDGNLNGSNIKGAINAIKAPLLAQKDAAVKTDVVSWKTEVTDPTDPNFGCMSSGSKGLLIANKRTADNREWDYRTAISADGIIADWLIGKLKTVLIENMDGSFRIDLNKSGGASFLNDGMLAMVMENNSLNFYNWGKDGDYIGALTALCQNDDPNKPLISLVNDLDSAVSIGYRDKKDSHTFHSYIDFDKYNILKSKQIAPIRIFEDVEMGNRKLYNPILDFEGKQIYNSVEKDLVFKFPKKQGLVLSGTNGTFAWISEEGWSLKNLFYYNNCVNASNDFYVGGNLKVNGKKNRVVKTKLFGNISLNAYETSECYFGDIGRGKLKNGKYILRLDPKYLATVNTNIQYEVRTWAYGEGNVWVETKDMYPQYAIVRGDNDIEFGYEIMAKQKYYENIRLEEESKRKKEGKDENN